MGILNDNSPGHVVLYVFIFGIPVIICVTLLCLLIYGFNTNSKKKTKLKFKILSIVAITSLSITSLSYLIADGFQYDVFWGRESYAMVSLFWGHGNASAYILFVQRIYTSFGQSEYNPQKWVYTYFYSCILFVYLCQIYIVIFFLLLLKTNINPQFALNNINTVNGLEIIVQLILSTSLMYIFVNKLNQIMATHAKHAKDKLVDLTASRVEFDNKQDALLKVVTKQTLLSTFAASTTCAWLIFAGIMDVDWIFYPNSDMELKYVLHFLTGIGLMLDCTVNSLAIFLSFAFSKPYYEKICKSCHVCCIVQCKKNTAKLIIKQTLTEAELAENTKTQSSQ